MEHPETMPWVWQDRRGVWYDDMGLLLDLEPGEGDGSTAMYVLLDRTDAVAMANPACYKPLTKQWMGFTVQYDNDDGSRTMCALTVLYKAAQGV